MPDFLPFFQPGRPFGKLLAVIWQFRLARNASLAARGCKGTFSRYFLG
jgi:hypothetical protein